MMNSSRFDHGLTKLDHSDVHETQQPFFAKNRICPLLYGTPFRAITVTKLENTDPHNLTSGSIQKINFTLSTCSYFSTLNKTKLIIYTHNTP